MYCYECKHCFCKSFDDWMNEKGFCKKKNEDIDYTDNSCKRFEPKEIDNKETENLMNYFVTQLCLNPPYAIRAKEKYWRERRAIDACLEVVEIYGEEAADAAYKTLKKLGINDNPCDSD